MFVPLALVLPAFAPPAAAPADLDPALPRVLLIGDSISIGYTDPVRAELKGEANVFRVPANGGPTTRGLERIDAWLGDERWDVIHVNFGLHDLKHVGPDGRNVAPPAGTHQVPPEVYRKNLAAIFDRLKKTGAVLIWATITPVPDGSAWRTPGDAARYNALAAVALKDRGVRVNDLFAAAKKAPDGAQRPANVHFTPAGSKVLAKAVADAVRAALAERNAPSAK